MHSTNQKATDLPQDSQSPSIPRRTTFPSSDEYDYLIIGDGSGHPDGLGGFGAFAISARDPRFTFITSFGTTTHMSVARAEFMAVLNALQSIMVTCKIDSGSALSNLARTRPTVYILSDNESLIGTLVLPTWERKANLDLWAMYTWYEKYFNFKASWIPRDTLTLHKSADAIASGMRLQAKDTASSIEPIKNQIDKAKAIASEAVSALEDFQKAQKSVGNI